MPVAEDCINDLAEAKWERTPQRRPESTGRAATILKMRVPGLSPDRRVINSRLTRCPISAIDSGPPRDIPVKTVLGSRRWLPPTRRQRFERFTELSTHFSYVNREDNIDMLSIYHAEKQLMLWLNGQGQTDDLDINVWDVALETWNHLCHILSRTTYTIYWQGEELFTGNLEAGWSLEMNGSLVLGQEQDSLGGGFDVTQVMIGEIAQVSIWDRAFWHTEVVDMAACHTLGRGNIFNSDTDELEVYGVTFKFVDVESFCRSPNHYYMILPEEQTLSESNDQCQMLKAPLAVPNDATDNDHLTEELLPYEQLCSPGKDWKQWLGISDI
ncbi:uncharacterized protein LOC121876029 [Homarus americanus]|uniref:uncharacterized protein LOC121876029 n=1 Tax=Homarus americanus TaxID=6706 RepID=UPI001C481D9B|nr:uncharacterized protein LOC121876029 [Homarus americanus]